MKDANGADVEAEANPLAAIVSVFDGALQALPLVDFLGAERAAQPEATKALPEAPEHEAPYSGGLRHAARRRLPACSSSGSSSSSSCCSAPPAAPPPGALQRYPSSLTPSPNQRTRRRRRCRWARCGASSRHCPRRSAPGVGGGATGVPCPPAPWPPAPGAPLPLTPASAHAAGARPGGGGCAAGGARARAERRCPPPRTNWTRRIPQPVLIGHAASLTPY